ncbi:hypothetical protein CRYUN_Cryun21dG0016900 [Craigia yunnanensis]
MGSTVLAVTQDATPNLHVHAHCAKKKSGISLILINLSNDKSFDVTLSNDENLHTIRHKLKSTGVVRPNPEFRGYQNREKYHLTVLDENIQSDMVLLNEVPLTLTDSLDIPAINPKLVDASIPISVAVHSIVYVAIRNFHAPACA